MIELTPMQVQALENADAIPPRLVNPETQETFVLLSLAQYEGLKEGQYDDGPWTDDEMDQLRQEACEILDEFGKAQ